MVYACVLECIADGLLHVAGIEAGPDLGADPGTVGVLPVFVEHFTGKGRQNTAAHIGFAHAVFVPVGLYEAQPVLAQGLGVDVFGAQLIHRPQPHQLQIQVVVGQGLTWFRIEPGDIQDLPAALVGGTDGAADVFAQPAGVD